MSLLDQYRDGMKALGCSDKDIEERISLAASTELNIRKRKLREILDDACKGMTTEELIAFEKLIELGGGKK